MTDNGYVKLFRRLNQKGFDAVTLGYVSFFLINACFDEYEYFDGDRNIKLKPGQYISSVRVLSKKLGVSIQTHRSTIKKLENSGFLTQQVTHKYTIFQVQNWSKWQVGNTPTNTRGNTLGNTPSNTKEKNIKKYKEIKEGDPYSFNREAARRELEALRAVTPVRSLND